MSATERYIVKNTKPNKQTIRDNRRKGKRVPKSGKKNTPKTKK